MCGIVGFKSNQHGVRLRESLPKATSRLIHRGPDDTDLFFDPAYGVGLGHRRLSVIDLSEAGRQPMDTEDGRVHIVYNGEIYNFKEIRQTLAGQGHRFRTETDTEVILKAYGQWGMDCLTRFVGMFAFALWDRRLGRLFLARDRIGIKPLYYHYKAGTFLFASELKSLMAFKDFPRDIDPEAVPLFLHYQYIPGPRTIFRNTFKLLPGHFLVHDGENLRTHAYWTLPPMDEADVESSEADVLDALDRILGHAVSSRLISDVPLGALLSGGIDSSMVAALMQKASHRPVRTFSIGFREPGYDEAPWAAKVAAHLGTDHTAFYVTARDALEVIPRLPEIYDEPFADASAVPTCLVSKLARTRVTVALSGDGGDEQFAGYIRYWSARSMVTAFQRLPEPVRSSLGLVLRKIPVSWVETCYLPWRDMLPQRFRVANFGEKWQKLVNLMFFGSLEELYRMTICLWSESEVQSLLGRDLAPSQYEGAFAETRGWPILSRLMRVDQRTYLPDAMLTKVDRASMAFSLEIRVPLLDHRVLEFTARIPDSLKYRRGKSKYLLRKLLARYVPETLFERPKMGFGMPIDSWFRGEMKELLLDYLSAERLKKEGLFHPEAVEQKIKAHLGRKTNHQYRLWALLMWEMWRERWLG
ncbi:MAG: asparagine synthase (glutamine-hydrolyzing) [Desulfatiglandaceae bacterium]